MNMNKKTIVIILLAFLVQNLTSQERCVDVAYEFSLGKYNILVPSVMPNDIFVYFNDRRINNNVIEEGYKEFGKNYRGEQIRDKCYFVILERENFILKKFILFGHSGDGYIDQYYIKENGEIVYGGHMWACD